MEDVKLVLGLSRSVCDLCGQTVKSIGIEAVFHAVNWCSALCNEVLIELLSLSATVTQEITNTGFKSQEQPCETVGTVWVLIVWN